MLSQPLHIQQVSCAACHVGAPVWHGTERRGSSVLRVSLSMAQCWHLSTVQPVCTGSAGRCMTACLPAGVLVRGAGLGCGGSSRVCRCWAAHQGSAACPRGWGGGLNPADRCAADVHIYVVQGPTHILHVRLMGAPCFPWSCCVANAFTRRHTRQLVTSCPAELRSLQAVAEPAAPLLDIAVLDIAAGTTQGPYAPPANTPASDLTTSPSAPAEAGAAPQPGTNCNACMSQH